MSNVFDIMAMGRKGLDSNTKSLIQAPVNSALIQKNQYDKFGNGDYIDVETIGRLLTEVFGVWSWEIIRFYHEKENGEYVVAHGRLSIPGVGVREGIGQAKADKKDNSTMYSSAASFALKSAAKRFGIAPNLFDQKGWNAGVDVFEQRPKLQRAPQGTPAEAPSEPPAGPPPVKQGAASQPAPDATTMPDVEAYAPPEKKVPSTTAEKGAELRDAYGIQTKGQFVAFAQIWNPQITAFEQVTAEVMDALHSYVENNPEEFEDFKATDYQ